MEFLNTGEYPIYCKYFITVMVPSLDKSWIAYLEMSVLCIINSFHYVTWHTVTGNFLFSSLPDSNLFPPSAHCLILDLGLFIF